MAERADPPVNPAGAEVPPAPPPGGRMGRRGGRFVRDLTSGSITKGIFALALPTMAGQLFSTLDMTIDMIWVGRLGGASIATVGSGMILVQVLMAARMGLTTGTRALVARAYGAGDVELANRTVAQAFLLSGGFAMSAATVGVIFAPNLMRLSGLSEEVVETGSGYMRLMFISSMAMSFQFMATSALQASGDAVIPMWIMMGQRVFHFIIDPFLIFGWLFFPRLEVSGAAVANVASQSAGALVGITILILGVSRLKLSARNLGFDRQIMWSIVKVGTPASVTGAERAFSQWLMLRIMAEFGTLAVAAHGIHSRLQWMFFMPGMGMGMASATMVGQNLGAGKPDRASRSAWYATGYFMSAMVVTGVLSVVYASPITRIFMSDPKTASPELIDLTIKFVIVGAAGLSFMAASMVLMQALQGAGETVGPMVISLVTLWGVQLPLALLLSPIHWSLTVLGQGLALPTIVDLGVLGVRWAIVIALAVRFTAFAVWFAMGHWKKVHVMPSESRRGFMAGLREGPM